MLPSYPCLFVEGSMHRIPDVIALYEKQPWATRDQLHAAPRGRSTSNSTCGVPDSHRFGSARPLMRLPSCCVRPHRSPSLISALAHAPASCLATQQCLDAQGGTQKQEGDDVPAVMLSAQRAGAACWVALKPSRFAHASHTSPAAPHQQWGNISRPQTWKSRRNMGATRRRASATAWPACRAGAGRW